MIVQPTEILVPSAKPVIISFLTDPAALSIWIFTVMPATTLEMSAVLAKQGTPYKPMEDAVLQL